MMTAHTVKQINQSALALSFLLFLMALPLRAETTMTPFGIVEEVSNCRSGKYSLRCTVKTSTHVWETDITDWPGNIVQKGDQLALRDDIDGGRSERWLCRNGACRASEVQMDAMLEKRSE